MATPGGPTTLTPRRNGRKACLVPSILGPANWLDWCILVYIAFGVLAGLRRGFILSLVALVAAVGAVALAVHLSPTVATLADARWQVQTHVAVFVGHAMPLPDGAGATPYSPSAAAVLGQQLGAVTSPAYARAVSATLQALPRASAPLPPTLGAWVDAAVAARLVAVLAFLAVFLVSETVLLSGGRLLFGGAGRRGLAGLANTLLGAAAGGVERLAQAAMVLLVLVSLSLVPAFSGLAGVLQRSHWAPTLIAVAKGVVPTPGQWLPTWLTRA